MTRQKSKPQHIDQTGWWVLFATISASSMAFIGGSALNVALPAVQEDLRATGAELLWIVNSFALLLAALILVGGSLGDHLGRKRVYMVGITVFTGASVVCGLSPTTELLIVARAVQGIGGALMIPGSLAIISAYFDGVARGRAIGLWSSITTLTSVLGPVLGGVLAENGLWRAIFFINVPLALGALFALWRCVPESRDDEAPKQLDFLGAALVTLGLAGITFGAIGIGEVGPQGFTDPGLMGALLGGVVALMAFVWVEARSDHPMLSLRLFRSRTFTGTNVLTLFLYGALAAALFFLPLNLVQIQGYGETLAGLAMLPFSVLLILMSPRMGGLVERIGPRPPLVIGPAIVGVAFIALGLPQITAGPQEYWTTFVPGALLLGIGMGATVAPLTTTVMGSVPQHNAGMASGVNNAMSRSSQVLATSILGGIALLFFSSSLMGYVSDLGLPAAAEERLLADSADLAQTAIPQMLDEAQAAAVQSAIDRAFIDTFRLTMFISAGLCFLSALLAWLLVEPKLKPPAELLQEAPGSAPVAGR